MGGILWHVLEFITMTFLNMVRFSNIYFFCGSLDRDKLFRHVFPNFKQDDRGRHLCERLWVKFSPLKRKLYLWEKIVVGINKHYEWSFYFKMPKMNISSYQQHEPVAINYCYHEGDLQKPYYQKKSYLTYTIMLLPVTILDLYKIIICKLSTIYTPFLRKRNVCSHR